MSTSLKDIQGYLESNGLKSEAIPAENCVTVKYSFPETGDFTLVTRLEDEGRVFKAFVPELLSYRDGRNKLAVMQTMLVISWETRFLQWEYDPDDGEIRAMIEFPIEDAKLTRKQFLRVIEELINLVRVSYPRLKAAMEGGSESGAAAGEGDTSSLLDAWHRAKDEDGEDEDIPDAL